MILIMCYTLQNICSKICIYPSQIIIRYCLCRDILAIRSYIKNMPLALLQHTVQYTVMHVIACVATATREGVPRSSTLANMNWR